MPRCTTNSIRSAISLRGKSTSRDALQPWLSGALSWHRSPLARWRSRCMSTSLRYLDTAVSTDVRGCRTVLLDRAEKRNALDEPLLVEFSTAEISAPRGDGLVHLMDE